MQAHSLRRDVPSYPGNLFKAPTLQFVVSPPPVPRDPQQFFDHYSAYVRPSSRLSLYIANGMFADERAYGTIGMVGESFNGTACNSAIRKILPHGSAVPFWAALETFLLQKAGKASPLLTNQQHVTVMPLTDERFMLSWCYFKNDGWFVDVLSGHFSFGIGTRMLRTGSHIVSH